jgi:hypothetical protein
LTDALLAALFVDVLSGYIRITAAPASSTDLQEMPQYTGFRLQTV